MKLTIFLQFSILMIIACGKNDGKIDSKDSANQKSDTLQLVTEQVSTKGQEQEKQFDVSLLQGVWWLDKNDVSALFKIEGDYLYYTEDLKSPYLIKVKGDLFWMTRDKKESVFKLKILTKDSLVFHDKNIDEDIFLIKKR